MMKKVLTPLEYLKEQLIELVVEVQYKYNDTVIKVPLTLRSDLKQGQPEEVEGSIVAWNIVTQQFTTIPADAILSHTVRAFIHKDEATAAKEGMQHPAIAFASTCRDALNRMTIPDKYEAVMCDEIQTHNMCDTVLKLMSVFDCKYPDLISPTKEVMDRSREKYMDYIREHREKAFEELDQLEVEAKEQNSSDSDLEDINQIKQMFRDIPQETDLSKYTTLKELLDFWPSLLLPKPPEHNEQCTWWLEPEETRSMDQLETLLSDCEDASELELLLEQLAAGDLEYPIDTVEAVTARIEQLRS